jgi:hypothetical protein
VCIRHAFVDRSTVCIVKCMAFPPHMRVLPDGPMHLPLANDSTLPDSEKVRFELKYLAEIFKAWKEVALTVQDNISLQNLLTITNNVSREVVYEHDGLAYQSLYCMGSKVHKAGKHSYFQIPLVNSGYLYRIIETKDILQRDVWLHPGKTHPCGIGGYVALTEIASGCLHGFARFAVDWFNCSTDGTGPESLNQSVYYNDSANRVDIVFERRDYPTSGDRVSLEFCFEPGWPLKQVAPASFPLTKAYLDGQK